MAVIDLVMVEGYKISEIGGGLVYSERIIDDKLNPSKILKSVLTDEDLLKRSQFELLSEIVLKNLPNIDFNSSFSINRLIGKLKENGLFIYLIQRVDLSEEAEPEESLIRGYLLNKNLAPTKSNNSFCFIGVGTSYNDFNKSISEILFDLILKSGIDDIDIIRDMYEEYIKLKSVDINYYEQDRIIYALSTYGYEPLIVL
jgi:hypothetical protein